MYLYMYYIYYIIIYIVCITKLDYFYILANMSNIISPTDDSQRERKEIILKINLPTATKSLSHFLPLWTYTLSNKPFIGTSR